MDLVAFDTVLGSGNAIDVGRGRKLFPRAAGFADSDLPFAHAVLTFPEGGVAEGANGGIVQELGDFGRIADFGAPGAVVVFDQAAFVVMGGEAFGYLGTSRGDEVRGKKFGKVDVAVIAETLRPGGWSSDTIFSSFFDGACAAMGGKTTEKGATETSDLGSDGANVFTIHSDGDSAEAD